jgi:SAM-dependent methyltransferase
MIKLSSEQVDRHPLSYGDASGYLFRWGDNIFRAIDPSHKRFFEDLLNRGILSDLADRGLIAKASTADIVVDNCDLVLAHEQIQFPSYCFEWCGEMLKRAAIQVLRLENVLLSYGLTLLDPHPINVLFSATKPMWVDLGSVVETQKLQCVWNQGMFDASFTRPLKIFAEGHHHLARSLLLDLNLQGVSESEYQAITQKPSPDLKKVITYYSRRGARAVIPSALRRLLRPAVKPAVQAVVPQTTNEISRLIESHIEGLQNITFPTVRTRWSHYYDDNDWFFDFGSSERWSDKQRNFLQILRAEMPRSLLDIGANRGWYSQVAARSGVEVVAVDFDEVAMNRLFNDAEKEELPILPLIADFRSLHPRLALARRPGIPASERLQCDMVLALALVHHLVVTHELSFPLIAQGFSDLAKKSVLTEFIEPTDRHVKDWKDRWPPWYSFDNFVASLKKEFRSIKILSSNEPSRRLILCEK